MSRRATRGQLQLFNCFSCPYLFIAFRVRIFSLSCKTALRVLSFHCPARPLKTNYKFSIAFHVRIFSRSCRAASRVLILSLEVDGALGEAHDLRELAESTACCGANRKFILPLEMEEELDLREPGRSPAWCVASCPEPGPEPAVPLLMDAVHDKAGRSRPPICPQCPSRSCRDCRYATFQGCGARQGRQEPHESMDWRTQRATWTKHDQQKRTANLTDELSRQTNKIGNVGS